MKPKAAVLISASVALAIALFIGVEWFKARQTARVQETAKWVAHTYVVRAERNQLLTRIWDIEVAQSRYVLTGQPEFLTQFEYAVQRAAEQERRLTGLTHDEEQKASQSALKPLIAERIAVARTIVELRTGSGFAAAAREAVTLRGRSLTEQIRDQFADMNARSDVVLQERSAAADREAAFTRRLEIVGTGLGLALFGTALVLGLRENRLHRQASLALRESEESLAVTLHSIGDAVLATDAAGRVTRLNAVAETLTGWPHAESVGRPVAEIFHIINEDTRQPAFIPVTDTLAKGTIHGLANHTVLIARDGTERPIADSCAPIRDRTGQVIGAVLVFRDVTQEKTVEAALRKGQRELETVVRANNLIMTHSLDVICTIDERGCFVFVSAACERVWGYRPEELMGRRYLDLVHPDDHPKTNQAAADIMAGSSLHDFENRYYRKDGSLVPIVWSASWSAEEHLMFCVARNITERKRSEESLRQAHAELARANAELAKAARLKDEFLANMSHELRTPLNSILGLSESLLEQMSGPLTARQIKSVTTIAKSGEHLLALINDILDLSKIEAGRLELHAEPLRVDEFCQSCLAFVRTQAMEKKIGVAFEHDGRMAQFSADARRLKQILVNLLTNAVKFTPEGGRIGLTVAAPEDEEVVRFTVWDTGIGIAPADQGKLFRSFTQIDSGLSRAQEGTGLGLALVAKLVELHGGSVALESEPGKGSRFVVTLPRDTTSRPVREHTTKNEPDRRGYRRALIIEDDATSGAILVNYLNGLGMDSVLHVSGEKSVEAVLCEQPDVILLDILLPNDSGWVVLTRLKEHPRTRDIPVAVVSVVDEPGKSLALGAAAHFTKPVTREQLAGFLQRDAVPHRPSKPPFLAPVPTTGPAILLAEDNEANIETIGGYLTDKGYTMHYATNGLLAVTLARQVRPALVLMDIQMPVMDGFSAIRELRSDDALKAIPIVALTALAMPGDRERCLEAGATDYMGKPVSLKALASLVQRLVPEGSLTTESDAG